MRVRNAGAVVFDVDGELIRRDAKADHRFGAESDGILHQIGDGAVQVVRPHRGHGMRGAVIGDLAPHVAELVGDELQRAGDVGQRHGFEPAAVAQERQYRFQHRTHLIEIVEHAAVMGLVLDEFGAKTHSCNRRAQIVADCGEHFGAVVDQAGDALPHAIERARDRADFLRPAFGQRRRGAIEAKTLGGLCEG